MRYFFHIGYHGFAYRGWQRQSNINSIQHCIETTLSLALKTPVATIGCGRTDAQVSASQFFFHVDIETPWDYDLIFRLNKLLPSDIAVFDIIPMSGFPHARFDATSRTYDYFIHNYKDPMIATLSSLYLDKDLRLDKMKKAVSLLPLYQDYRALCKTPDDYRHTTCHITAAGLFTNPVDGKIRFRITADRFLARMIRIIVKKLLDIGRDELSVEEFEEYLITQKSPGTIEPAYPQGLHLSKVDYPFLNMPVKSGFSILQEVEWIPVN